MFIRERSYNLLLRFIIKSSNLDLNSIKKLKKPKIYGNKYPNTFSGTQRINKAVNLEEYTI